MADKTAQATEVETTAEELTKTKGEDEIVPAKEDDSKSENGDVSENGAEKEDTAEEKVENGVEEEEDEETEKVSCVKRKSVSSTDVKDDVTAEGATPEKKAKLDEAADAAEANGDSEVAA